MPSPSDFRKAFGLAVDQTLGGKWRITSSSFRHEVKEQNERYEFPAAVDVEWAPSSGGGARSGKHGGDQRRELEACWAQQTSKRRIVYSAYGSPYECFFVKAPKVTPLDEEGRSFQVTALGRAVRRRDIPTLKEAKAAEREAAGAAAEVSKEDERRYLGGCRVIKSRFGTSKCGICGQTIDPGVKIAKGEGDSGRGSWAHATCLVHQIKAGGGDDGSKWGRAASEADEATSSGSGEEAEEAGHSDSAEESEEEAPPGKRKRTAPAAGRKSGGSNGRKAAARAGGKRGGAGGGKAEAAGGAAAGQRRASAQREE